MRWLWRDYPEPIRAGHPARRRTDIVIPGEGWKLVSERHRFTEGPAVNARGEVFFTDIPEGKIHRVDLEGRVSVFVENSPGVNGLMFSDDGFLVACQNGTKRIVRYDASGKEEVILENAPSNDLVVLPEGGYYTDPANHRIWHVNAEGKRQVVDEGLGFPNGLIPSTDQTFLWVSDTRDRFVYSYKIEPDGKLSHRQKYGWLHRGDADRDAGADGMTVDTEGRLYVTTRLGIQVLDQLGRVHLILDRPQDAWVSNVVFGGPELDHLYVTCGDRVYRRKLKARGVVPWQPPVQAPRPRL